MVVVGLGGVEKPFLNLSPFVPPLHIVERGIQGVRFYVLNHIDEYSKPLFRHTLQSAFPSLSIYHKISIK